MENAIATLILVLVTVSMAVVLYGYYSSLTGYSYTELTPLQTAMELSKELQVSYSPPVVKYVVPTQKGQPLNFTVNTLVTLNLNYSGPVYVVPFLMNASYLPYYYVPPPMFSGGYINEVSEPNLVGYANVSGKGVKVVQLSNAEVYSLNGILTRLTAYAFEVPLNQALNFTYTTNSSYVPAFWVLAYIDGKYYRIAYPVIMFRPTLNAYSGSASTALVLNYGQLYQQLFGSYSMLFETQPGSVVTLTGTNYIVTPGAIGYYDGGFGILNLVGNNHIEASGLYVSPGTYVPPTGFIYQGPTPQQSNDIPYVPISTLINPLYSAFNPYQYQLQLEKEANSIYSQYQGKFVTNSTYSITVGGPVTINQPVIFTNPVTFSTKAGPGPYNVTFNAPVVFEGPVTDLGVNLTFNSLVIFMNSFTVGSIASATFNGPVVFEGNVGITNNFVAVFKQGVLFNSSSPGATVTFSAPTTRIISNGPIIMNLTGSPSSIVFKGGVGGTNIYSNSIISLTATQVEFKGNTNIQSAYPVFIQTTGLPQSVSFIGNSVTKISGGLVINSSSASVTLTGTPSLDITNGDLIINAGSLTANTHTGIYGTSEISVDGPIAIQSNYITVMGTPDIHAYGYVLLYGSYITIGGISNIVVNQGVPSNAMNNIKVEHLTPIALNPTTPIYVAGWFSVVPNNATINVVNATLINGTYQVSLTLAAVPKSPTLYDLVLYVNSTPYVLATVSPYKPYMYVMKGYVQNGATYLEVNVLSGSGQVVSETMRVTLPLYTGILLRVGPEPNYQVLVYAGFTDTPWQVVYSGGPYVNSTQYLEQVSNQVSYLQYYYLISPPTPLGFQMLPTYYVSGVGPLVLNVEANALSYVA